MGQRRSRLDSQIAAFVRQYVRKRHHDGEPNDRAYSRKVEKIVKRMKPEELDEFLHGSPDDADDPDLGAGYRKVEKGHQDIGA